MYNFNDELDKKILQPVARGYEAILPAPVNKGITNFFSNLDDVTVLINDLLQFKFSQAAHDAGRIVFNTTAGLLGFIDVASHMDMPKHDEDFGQTLGKYKLGHGAYFILPFLGPSSIRDSVGLLGDIFLYPIGYIKPQELSLGIYTYESMNRFSFNFNDYDILKESAIDPYTAVRDAYFQNRKAKVVK